MSESTGGLMTSTVSTVSPFLATVSTTVSALVEAAEDEPFYCNACLGSTDPDYQLYNFYISGILLALVGCIGLVGNICVMRVYLDKEHCNVSTNLYLAALAFSDFFLILTAMFLFVLESWRHHNYPLLAYFYVMGAPIVFPLAAVFQTSSVYFCVAAAVDCFITVVLPESVRVLYCTPKRAKTAISVLMSLCILYNIPHFFEIERIDCLDNDNLPSQQICPTDVRQDPIYYTIYYTYMYTTFLAVGPLILLVLLNICVVFTVCTKSSTAVPDEEGGDPPASSDSDTISLILVVFFFIFCNFAALMVNFMEIIINDQNMLVYFVDLSNLLVVINGTANFFCYLGFGQAFRNTLCEIINDYLNRMFSKRRNKPKLIWKEEPARKLPDTQTMI